jgi:hypothetical protein
MPGEKIEAKVTKSLFSFAIGKIEIRMPGMLSGDRVHRPSKHDWHLELAKEAMPVACHEQLEWIVNNSDVHAECLELACKTKALVCREGRLARGAALPDYVLSLVGIAVLALFGGYALRLWLSYHYPLTSQLALFACLAASAFAAWSVQRRFIYPHHVARRALAAQEKGRKYKRSRPMNRRPR